MCTVLLPPGVNPITVDKYITTKTPLHGSYRLVSKGKGKVHPYRGEQALRLCTGRTAHRGSRGIALIFLDNGTRMGEWSASRPGRSLLPGKSRYPLHRRLGGPQGGSGQVRKISSSPGFDSRTVQPVASRYTD